jgi:ABC-type antimicrobial peptide transport system permease subunit
VVLTLVATLTLLLTTVAALGVFNTVVLNSRDQVNDIGVLKAIGMTPRQVRVMVITSMALVGAVAGTVAVPLGSLLHHSIVPIMANAAGIGSRSPPSPSTHLPNYSRSPAPSYRPAGPPGHEPPPHFAPSNPPSPPPPSSPSI